MKENEGLRPNDLALRYFFSDDTLYIDENTEEQAPSTPSVSEEQIIENPATPVFDGSKNAEYLFLFSHQGTEALEGEAGAMLQGLISNEKAMNLKASQTAFCLSSKNPNLSFSELLNQFPMLRHVLVWGASQNEQVNNLAVLSNMEMDGKIIHHFASSENYLQPENKKALWLYIKANML